MSGDRSSVGKLFQTTASEMSGDRRSVGKLFQTTASEMSGDRRSVGKLFQTTGPLTAKLLATAVYQLFGNDVIFFSFFVWLCCDSGSCER